MDFTKVQLGEYFLFYNEGEKIIGRIPTPSNIALTGSDNSLYFGIYGATRGGISSTILENIIGVSRDDFSNHNFNMKWQNHNVILHTNLNADGQIQIKITFNGYQSGVSKLVNIFMEENNMTNFDGYGIFIDFKNMRISCQKVVAINNNTVKIVSSRRSRAKKELQKIIDEVDAKFPSISVPEKNAYIDTLIHARSSSFQKIYRDRLIKEFGCKCAICNINVKEMLIASHIVAYKDCQNNEERIDYNNGLLLCPLHDSLFDKGYISFAQDGKIEYAFEGLEKMVFDDFNIYKDIKLDEKYLSSKRKEYLLRHKRKF